MMSAQHDVIKQGLLDEAIYACADRVSFVSRAIDDYKEESFDRLSTEEKGLFCGALLVLADVKADLNLIAEKYCYQSMEEYCFGLNKSKEEVSDGG